MKSIREIAPLLVSWLIVFGLFIYWMVAATDAQNKLRVAQEALRVRPVCTAPAPIQVQLTWAP